MFRDRSSVRWIAGHIIDVAFGAAITLFIGWAIRKFGIFFFKLGENAVLGEISPAGEK